jgi:hypothetical protein
MAVRDDGYDGYGEPERDQPPVLPPLEIGKAIEALPGLARIAASTWLHTVQWGAATTWRLTRRVAAASRDPELAAELARELGVTVAAVRELGRQVSEGVALQTALASVADGQDEPELTPGQKRQEMDAHLRRRGEELLMRSRDVWNTDQAHPAYERILDDLAPDEARILVFLLRAGPQPSVDVRTGGPVGMVSSRLVAPGLTMIGARAGCRYPDYVPSYLNNLFRLGLVWFSRETLRDPTPYQVLEAQPDVLAAMHSVRMPKVVRRSIHLTPFGQDFCATVLAPEVDPDEHPPHEVPEDDDEDSPT